MKNINNYIEWLQKKNLSLPTIQNYSRIISQYGNNLTTNLVDFFKNLTQEKEPATCLTYLATFRSYAQFQGITEIDWTAINKLIPKMQKKFYTTINQNELTQLKQVRFEKQDWLYERNNLILDFLFYSGLRVSELVKIRYRDWAGNSLRVHGKGNRVRHILLPDFLTQHFKSGSSYLFLSKSGKKIPRVFINRIIGRRVELAKINKWITPHTFRRSLATNLYNRGGRLETISKQLGHSSSDTTLGYIHSDFESLYQDYSKLFQNQPQGNKSSLNNYSTAELLAEIGRRMGNQSTENQFRATNQKESGRSYV